MGGRRPAARGCVWKCDSEQSECARCNCSKQHLALDSLEEHHEISLDQRTSNADFRNQAGFAGYAAVYAQRCILKAESDDCHGHPLQSRRKGSCTTTKCPEKARLRIRPGDRRGNAQAEELQIERSACG